MKRIAIVGAQWGDEGKGKLVNYHAPRFDWVVRFAGGANAGHTIYHEGRKYVNHLLPSIALEGDRCRGFLGAGMVLDLPQLLRELRTLEADFPGIARRFHVDPEVFLVLPWHKREDQLFESYRATPIGTTGRGIGPAYADKATRLGVKLSTLFEESLLCSSLAESHAVKTRLHGDEGFDAPERVLRELLETAEALRAIGVHFTAAVEMAEALRESSVLFEGAQGVMLDLDFGTYPFVTSSSTMAYGVSSVGFSTFDLDDVVGVLKAYTTRVGGGPFPSEASGAIADSVREKGKEYGATTGRPRRIGWLDLPALRYAKHRSGLTSLIITKADVLDGLPEIPVCVAYRVDGVEVSLPRTSRDFFRAEPVFRTVKGWPDTRHRHFLDYLSFIEAETGLPISAYSHGPLTHEVRTREDLIRDVVLP